MSPRLHRSIAAAGEHDLRLALRRAALERRLTALETALSQLCSQSGWLAGHASHLDAASGGLLDTPGGDPTSAAQPEVTAWEIALDRIELDVVRGERNLARGLELRTDPWDLPEDDLGSLPVALVERAAAIHRRQQELIEKVRAALHCPLRRRSVAEAAGRGQVAGPPPLQVDVVV